MNHPDKEAHEITKVGVKYKFLYFLRDLGIKSAHEPAVNAWKRHIEIMVVIYNSNGIWDDVQ